MRLSIFLNDYNNLSEASFNFSKIDEVIRLITNIISKKLGFDFFKFGGEKNFKETFVKSNGSKGIGFRFLTNTGKMYRFNWENEFNSTTFTSVDIWNSLSNDLEKPSLTIEFPLDMNIIQSLDKIVKALKMTSPGSIDLNEGFIENRYLGEEEKIVKKRGRPRKDGGNLKIEVKKGEKELNSVSKTIKDDKKLLDGVKYADVETIFSDIEDLVRMVSIGSQPSLLITGMPGIGKTYIVTNVLKQTMGPEGDKWISVKGKTSTLGLYSTLFLHRDQLIVFDDCDSVFSNGDAVNLLKGALDSYEKRTISWISPATINVSRMTQLDRDILFADIEGKLENDPSNSKIKYPSQFDFEGKVIFISNLPESKMDTAIKSRSMTIDVTLSQQDVIKRIKSILPYIGGDTDVKVKTDVLDFLQQGVNEGTIKEVNMRSFLLSMRIKESGSDRWQHLIKNYV